MILQRKNVIMDVEKKRKFACVDTNDIPNAAIVDPDMMLPIVMK